MHPFNGNFSCGDLKVPLDTKLFGSGVVKKNRY